MGPDFIALFIWKYGLYIMLTYVWIQSLWHKKKINKMN